jgi:hypothetical protein
MPNAKQVAYHEAAHAVLIVAFGGEFGRIEIGDPKLEHVAGDEYRLLRGCVYQTVEVPENRRPLVALAGVVGMLQMMFGWTAGTPSDHANVDTLVRQVGGRFTESECGSDLRYYKVLTGLTEPSRQHVVETANALATDWARVRLLGDELVRTGLAPMSWKRARELIG